MLGQMMHRPLSIIEILKFAAEAHPRAEMVSVRTEGDIHRQTYADSLRRVGQLAHALKKRGVIVVPGEYFFFGDDDHDWKHRHECLRISFAMADADVRAGIKIIGEEIATAY